MERILLLLCLCSVKQVLKGKAFDPTGAAVQVYIPCGVFYWENLAARWSPEIEAGLSL